MLKTSNKDLLRNVVSLAISRRRVRKHSPQERHELTLFNRRAWRRFRLSSFKHEISRV